MSCVICGKEQDVVRANSVKYATQTTLPEVLATVIGNKISCEDWNDGSQHICGPCNQQCEQYDKLNTKLQGIKESIFQEYSRRIYLDSREEALVLKRIRLKPWDRGGDDNVAGIEDDEEKEGEKSKKLSSDAEVSANHDTAEESSERTKQGECSLTIERLRESSPEDATKEVEVAESGDRHVTRVTEKTNIRRLPDYEYDQWYTLDGYCYVLRSQTSRAQLLACHKSDCRVTVRGADGPLARITGEHTHEPDRRLPERNMLYDKLKKRCMEDLTTPIQTIYEEEAKKFPGGASYLPFPEVRMREWRAAKDSTITVHTDVSMAEEPAKKYQCDVCNMGFNSSRLLTRHSRQHERCSSPEEDDQRKSILSAKKMHGTAVKKMKMSTSTPVAAMDKKLKKTLDKKMNRVLQKLQGVTEKSSPVTSEILEIQALDDDWDESKIEGERLWKCHVCSEELGGVQELKRHIVERHRDVLMCRHCDIAFDTPRLLKRHTTFCRKCCDERKQNKQKEADEEEVELRLIAGSDQDAGAIEDEDGDPNWDETQERDEDDEDLIEEADDTPKTKSKTLKCEVCPMSFPRLQQLTQHLYTHSSVKQFGCPRCAETFAKKAMLTRHMLQEKHSGQIKINPPHIDPTQLNETPGIKYQWRSIVDDHRYYECAICSDTFNSDKGLFAHMREQRHKSDKMIVHDRPPQEKRTPTLPPAPVRSKHVRRADTESRGYSKLISEGPIVIGGVKYKSKQEAMEAWYRLSGKKPVECAVCGAGFDTRVRLLGHMEKEEHLTDSIIENVPELNELGTYYSESSRQEGNQIVPSDAEPTIKQEAGKVAILSQVIISPEEETPKEENAEEDEEPTYFIQTENVNGETVMVIQGDLDGSLHENMQLFMDEEGNIVTQDEDGNTVKVMQVDLSKVQNMQHEADEISELDASEHNMGDHAQEENPNMSLLGVIEKDDGESKVGLSLDNTGGLDENAENGEDTEGTEVKNLDGAAENMEGVAENEENIEENNVNVRDSTEENMKATEENVEGSEENVEGTENNSGMEVTEENTEGTEDDVEDTEGDTGDIGDSVEDAEENVEDIAHSEEATTKTKEDINEEKMSETIVSTGENAKASVDNAAVVQSVKNRSNDSIQVKKEERRKDLLTPRKSTRNLEKSEKGRHETVEKADTSMSNRLRRTRTVK